MKYFLLTLLLFISANASAVNFDLSYTTDAGTITQPSKIYSEINGQRFVDYIWIAYPQIDYTDPENPVPKPRTQQNEAQAYRDFADAMFAGVKANVLRQEDKILKEAATPPPLEPEPE
jgi:hypothetical protein